MTFDLTNPDKTPFSAMPAEAQQAIISALNEGREVERLVNDDWRYVNHLSPLWFNAPYRIPPRRHQINWDHVADHLVCMATSVSGSAWLMSGNAVLIGNGWSANEMMSANAFASFVPGDMPWQDSLVWRPGHGPK